MMEFVFVGYDPNGDILYAVIETNEEEQDPSDKYYQEGNTDVCNSKKRLYRSIQEI